MNDEKEVLVKIGALWDKQNSLQGKLGEARLVVLPNKRKESDNHPDRIVYVCRPRPKREEQGDNGSPF